MEIMNNIGNFPLTESAVHRVKAKQQRRGRPRKHVTVDIEPPERSMAAVGTLSRTKSLLLAALRVWELKQRVGG